MVKRGHEVDLEYSKKEIMDRMNNFFEKTVVEKIKFSTFEEDQKNTKETKPSKNSVTNYKYQNKIDNVKNDKIKKSLIELTKAFKEK